MLLSSRISTYDELRYVLNHRHQFSNTEISSQSKRSFLNNISTLSLTFRILSSLDYGCFVYGSASKSVLARLDVLQARAWLWGLQNFPSPCPAY